MLSVRHLKWPAVESGMQRFARASEGNLAGFLLAPLYATAVFRSENAEKNVPLSRPTVVESWLLVLIQKADNHFSSMQFPRKAFMQANG